MTSKRCECCGAYLDFGERCDCGGIAPPKPAAAPIQHSRAKLTPKLKRRNPPRKFDPDRAWQAFDYK